MTTIKNSKISIIFYVKNKEKGNFQNDVFLLGVPEKINENYHEASKGDLNIRTDKIFLLTSKHMFQVSHDGAIHPG